MIDQELLEFLKKYDENDNYCFMYQGVLYFDNKKKTMLFMLLRL